MQFYKRMKPRIHYLFHIQVTKANIKSECYTKGCLEDLPIPENHIEIYFEFTFLKRTVCLQIDRTTCSKKSSKSLLGGKIISSCASCKVETAVSPQALYFIRYQILDHVLHRTLCTCLAGSDLFHFMHLQCVCGTAKCQRLNALAVMLTDR